MNAIENSYNTILIITQDYVKSGWTRYEYQLAQEEMINRGHTIVPIFLEDPEEINIEDENLQRMMKSVTYIVWPGEGSGQKLKKFWDNVKRSITETLPDTNGNPTQETVNL